MPKKTDVPSRITRAAIALFSRQGYHGTSTREIARLADISEVTLFRYFERKEDVFWAALAACFDTLTPRLSALESTGRNAPPEVFIPRILNILIDTATFTPELVRLVAIALLEVHGKAEDVCRQHLGPLFNLLAGYFRNNIESGAIRHLNPAIAAFAIALTLMAHPDLSTLVESCELSTMNLREVADAYSQFWIGALTPNSVKESIEYLSSPTALEV
jgi:AcrR family transcriptional regulator